MRNAVALSLVACLAVPMNGLAQTNASVTSQVSDNVWARVLASKAEDRVVIALLGGAEIQGEIVRADTESLTLVRSRLLKGEFTTTAGESLGTERIFSRSEIVAVSLPKKSLSTDQKHGLAWAIGGGALVVLGLWARARSR